MPIPYLETLLDARTPISFGEAAHAVRGPWVPQALGATGRGCTTAKLLAQRQELHPRARLDMVIKSLNCATQAARIHATLAGRGNAAPQ